VTWVTAVVQTREGIRLVVNDGRNSVDYCLPDDVDLSPLGHCDALLRRRYEIDLAELTWVDSRQLLELGVPQAATECQSFFSFQRRGETHLIASQTLILGLLGNSKLFRQHLLVPNGLCSASFVQDIGESHLEAQLTERFTEDESLSRRVRGTIIWAHCFESASRMAGSVFRHAIDGRFDLDLPSARAYVGMTLQRVMRSTVLVRSICVNAIFPTEPTMLHAQGRVKTPIRLGSRPIGPHGVEPISPDVVPSYQGSWHLRDMERDVVQSILANSVGHQRDWESTFRRLGVAFTKFGRGVPWAEVCGSAEACRMQSFMRALAKAGRWERICDAVTAMRSASMR